MRCRRVWARDHSSSTWASTRSSGVPATVVCRGLHSDPSLAQTFGRLRLLQLAARELPVELGIHERHHVDPIDKEAAEEQVVAVDVESVHIDAAHRHTADIGEPQSGALQARLDEGRAFELLRAGIGRHRSIITDAGDSPDRKDREPCRAKSGPGFRLHKLAQPTDGGKCGWPKGERYPASDLREGWLRPPY